MSKYEGRMFLERLVELRGIYETTDHGATVMTVESAIAYAIALLDDPDRLDAILGVTPADPENATSTHPA